MPSWPRPTAPADRAAAYDALAPGARRLGAAFQKINFLRDLAEDHDVLHRRYFPGLDPDRICDADRDLHPRRHRRRPGASAEVMTELPASSRRAVSAAHATFTELSAPAPRDASRADPLARVRVPGAVKLRIAAGAITGGRS